MKTGTVLAHVLMSLVLAAGCADPTEQRLRQVQQELAQVLRTALREGDVRIQRTGDHLTIVIAERLLFDAGSPVITPSGIDVLARMGIVFNAASLKEIRVAGHADQAPISDPSTRYFEKLALSKARATHTVRAMKASGTNSQSVIVEWFGDIRPIASNETEEGRQMNRRVEILLYAGM
ncbi:MAG: OmpA family protein [Nitrospirota bacterium]|nr:OmpA family protein [Nitrospirota bacterium]MDP2381995.1 OmpA family protein [Nitrospirota bacterium]